ncbi:MAG: LacI family DNA-binding transcriptional regulator [Anaerolineales bacterium]|nr:LacI family DNA-binding transcriptional regulator [Anaerolineales bacterium]
MAKKKKPTIYDVAERSGISISTISRVLNNPEKVNPETRATVLDAIDKLGFVPKAEARARALSGSNRIGVITPFFTAPSFVQRLRGVASALATSNYELVIYTVDSYDRIQGYFSSIPFVSNLDGLIVMSLPIQKQDAQRFLDHGIETVLVEYSHPEMNCIEIDDFQGGVMATQYLIDKGHRCIAFVGDKEPHDFEIHPASARLKGFKETMRKAGLDLPDEYVRLFVNTQERAMQATRDMLSLPTPPTAIFAAADIQALSVLKVAREMGVKVPEQLAVIGFDDIDSAEYLDLTTIRQHLDESGKLAVEILLAHIADPSRPPQHVRLPLNLIERKTA